MLWPNLQYTYSLKQLMMVERESVKWETPKVPSLLVAILKIQYALTAY